MRRRHASRWHGGDVATRRTRADFLQTAADCGPYGVARKVNSPIVAFERGMQELGYVDGQNIDIEYRFADGKFDRLAELAGELITLSPNVIVAAITPAAVAARN